MATEALSLVDLEKTFANGVRAVDRLSLDIPSGQFLAIVGPSGCGKSTLLRIIAGLETPTSGQILRGTGVPPVNHEQDAYATNSIAYVFQDAHLLPWRTVLKNVTLPLEFRSGLTRERSERAREALQAVGLTEAANLYPAQLSGGMRMRVSLARALVTSPSLLLLDEPFAALDEITRQQLDDMLRALWTKQNMTVIFVTHSIAEAVFLAERVIVFSKRPANILLDHPVALPSQRDAALRGDPTFAAQTRRVFEALHAGGAA